MTIYRFNTRILRLDGTLLSQRELTEDDLVMFLKSFEVNDIHSIMDDLLNERKKAHIKCTCGENHIVKITTKEID